MKIKIDTLTDVFYDTEDKKLYVIVNYQEMSSVLGDTDWKKVICIGELK